MGAVRIVILAAAAVIAVILALLVGSMIKHKPPAAVAQAAAKPMTRVVVAAHDLPVGTRLSQGDLSWQSWPVESVNPAFITDGSAAVAPPPGGAGAVAAQTKSVATAVGGALTGQRTPLDALVGAIVREPILANEPVTNAKIVRGGQGGYMAVVLDAGMRALAVPATVASAAGGFILPGDRVDVLQARQLDTGAGPKVWVSETLLRNIRVLAIDQTPQAPKGGQAVVGTVVTLEIRNQDAEALTKARAEGELELALRPYSDAGGPSGSGDEALDTGTVRIVRDGQPSEITVTP